MDSENCNAIKATLDDALYAGQRALRWQRLSVGMGCMSMAASAWGLYFIFFIPEDARCATGHCNLLLEFLLAFLYNFRFLILGFAPLADDARLTRLVILLDIAAMLFDQAKVQDVVAEWTPFMFIDGFFYLSALRVICQRDATTMQAHLWLILAVNRLLSAFMNVIILLCEYYSPRYHASYITFFVCDLALGVLILSGALYRMQAWFRSLFETRRVSQVASGIAGLIADCSVEEALAQAIPRFRCISLEDLSFDDFVGSPVSASPVGRQLFERTRKCALGSCDAFLSHSWHDDAPRKWSVLQTWRAHFVARHKREPRIWFDKACIDQQDIKEDLRGLPVFLAGSKELLVLCGPSYLSRLWCIMEIFTFIHIGGRGQITVMPVLREHELRNDEAALRASHRNFDGRLCDCFSSEDKRRMLQIVDVAFGDMKNFNRAVRRLLNATSFKEAILRLESEDSSEVGSEESLISGSSSS